MSNVPKLVGQQSDSLREAFGAAISECANTDPTILVLDADVAGGTGSHHFRSKHHQGFIQCGIAEQNMIGVAAGLAITGYKPFVTTFATFMLRGFEQIRLSIAYSNKNQWTSYWYLDAEPINGLSKYPLSQDSIDKIWQACINDELFYLDNERNDNNNCNQMIFDDHQYEFVIIKDNKYNQISYYAPEFYLNNCPKRPQSKERKKIIRCALTYISYFKIK